jgi:hypothetical protein
MGGTISTITNWLHFADHQLARFRRSSGGLISAITQWLYSTDHQHPQLFAQLIRDLKRMPDQAILRIVREVRDGNW